MYWVYVLKSEKFSKTYVGSTNDIARRIKEHNSRKGIYTKRYVPWIIIHSEQIKSQSDARLREKWYKGRAGRNYIKKLLKNL